MDERARCVVLVDGATGLTKAHVTQEPSDAAWYAGKLARGTARYVGQGMDTRQALGRAGRDVAREFYALPGADGLERIDLPNGSVAALRWDDEVLEVCMLGDCYAVVDLAEGPCLVHDDTLDKLDDLNYERMYAYATERGVSMRQARRDLNPRFVENRLKMNQPDGYWAADVTCAGFGHETVRTFERAGVRSAFVCSDGFAAAVAMGVCGSVEALAQDVAAGNGIRAGELLREAEGEDADCLRVHRSKTSDDATYACVLF